MTVETGWEMERRTHFGEIVHKYDRARRGYPSALFEDVLEYARVGRGRKALEIGPGTGKATVPFLDAGLRVTAVELSANMAAFLREKFKGRDSFEVVVTPFEGASLEENGYDLIYAASAFHWVDAAIGCPKAFRLLRSGGAMALFRFNVMPAHGDPLYEQIQSVYERHYYSHYSAAGRPAGKTREELFETTGILRGYGFAALETYGFQEVSMKLYDAQVRYGGDEYIAFLDTLSDHRKLPEARRTALYTEIKEAIQEHGGSYGVDTVFQLYMGRKL